MGACLSDPYGASYSSDGISITGISLDKKELAQSSFDEIFDFECSWSQKSSQSLAPLESAGLEELFGNDDTDLKDTAMYLADPDEISGLTNMLADRLTTELNNHCCCDDIFLTLLNQRLYLIVCIYKAVEELKASNKSPWPTIRQFSWLHCSNQSPDYTILLGIRFLYAILNWLLEKNYDWPLKKSFLTHVAFLLGDLTPLSIEQKVGLSQAHFYLINIILVTDTVRKVLVHCAMSNFKMSIQQSHSVSKYRGVAATALVRLASARGRASDLLCIVRKLISEGYSYLGEYIPMQDTNTRGGGNLFDNDSSLRK